MSYRMNAPPMPVTRRSMYSEEQFYTFREHVRTYHQCQTIASEHAANIAETTQSAGSMRAGG
eukprot:1166040-Pyramimonas_sp.AAC.1